MPISDCRVTLALEAYLSETDAISILEMGYAKSL